MTLQEYICSRCEELHEAISRERLAGNKPKEDCERAALAEWTALEQAIARREVKGNVGDPIDQHRKDIYE